MDVYAKSGAQNGVFLLFPALVSPKYKGWDSHPPSKCRNMPGFRESNYYGSSLCAGCPSYPWSFPSLGTQQASGFLPPPLTNSHQIPVPAFLSSQISKTVPNLEKFNELEQNNLCKPYIYGLQDFFLKTFYKCKITHYLMEQETYQL